MKIEDNMKIIIFSKNEAIPKNEKIIDPYVEKEKLIGSQKNSNTTVGKMSEKEIEKIKDICEELKVKLSENRSKKKKIIVDSEGVRISTSLTPIDSSSKYNGSHASHFSQAATNVPVMERTDNKKVDILNEALKLTTINK